MKRQEIKKKICLLGAFGVGKTSLVRRFVYSEFDEKYHSTIGVKIDKKVIKIGDLELTMVIWDVAGEEEFFQIPDSYVQGSHGYLFVADGTREETLQTLRTIRERFQNSLGPRPEVILLNKADLTSEWSLSAGVEERFAADGVACLRTSAAAGENVEEAFRLLGAQLLDGN